MHTDLSIEVFDGFTTVLGNNVQAFADASDHLEVFETSAELAAKNWKNGGSRNADGSTRKKRAFNMPTYKWHALTHYPSSIQHKGPLDISSTQKVSSIKSMLTTSRVKRSINTSKLSIDKQIKENGNSKLLDMNSAWLDFDVWVKNSTASMNLVSLFPKQQRKSSLLQILRFIIKSLPIPATLWTLFDGALNIKKIRWSR